MGLPAEDSELRVGLLGGSFNPAHEGHVHISLQAKERLGLDQVWWLVTPKNPLKDDTVAPLEKRMHAAEDVVKGEPSILVTDIEKEINNNYSYKTIIHLRQRFPRIKFVWLMGADNLCIFHRWKDWEKIFDTIPIAILDRSPLIYEALESEAAQKFAANKLDNVKSLATATPPSWAYLEIEPYFISSTQIREETSWPTSQ